MRIADVLMDCADGDGAPVQSRRRRRRERGRDRSPSFQCLSPRLLLFRWLSKGRKVLELKGEKVKRETRRRGSERDESSSSALELKVESDTAEGSGQQPGKEDRFNLAVGFGLFYLIVAGKNELNKVIELRREMEELLHSVQEEFQSQTREILYEPSDSNKNPTCLAIDASESLCSDGHFSLQNISFVNPSNSMTIDSCVKSLSFNATSQEKSMEGIDQLEDELEAELERLQLHMDTGDIFGHPKKERVKVPVEDSSTEGSVNASLGEVVDPSETSNSEHFGVPPHELERRLHELLESRQQERIEDLEAALQCADQKLSEREQEVCWWKETARIFSQHVPMTSRLS